jgi:uncharacterized membrane protein
MTDSGSDPTVKHPLRCNLIAAQNCFISVMVARYIRPGRMSSTPAAEVTPEQILARRLARGEIDEDEYRRLLHALSSSTAESY